MVIDKDGNSHIVITSTGQDENGNWKDNPVSDGIHINDTYKIVYKNSRKPKRKIIEKVNGLNLLMGIQRYSSQFRLFSEQPELKKLPLDKVKSCFREDMRGIVETWGCQRMGLSTLLPTLNKEIKRDIKKDKDNHWLFLVFGFYGVNLLNHISESSNEDCRTITITDGLLSDEDIEEMTFNEDKWKTDEEKGWLKEEMKKYGTFSYEYSS